MMTVTGSVSHRIDVLLSGLLDATTTALPLTT